MDFFFEFCTQNINSIQKMKQITKWIFAVFVMLTASTAFSQGKISGTVVDSELNTPLSGVNVVVKGTSTGAVSYTHLDVYKRQPLRSSRWTVLPLRSVSVRSFSRRPRIAGRFTSLSMRER